MNKSSWFRRRIGSVLFWSVISAAFIGPGTVTTAAAAGAGYQFSLLWALVFSTLACMVLQEAAARIPLVSSYSLGEAIRLRYNKPRWRWLLWAVAGAIIFGGMAYQAGNLLGAVSGAAFLLGLDPRLWTALIAAAAALLLWYGNYRHIAQLMGLVVALMGIAFIWVVLSHPLDWGSVLSHALLPSLPEGSAWLVVGLIGTTIVPYNLFLASGISKGQSVAEMRGGLSLAILIGGLISMAILLVGTQISGAFSFAALAAAMRSELGPWAVSLFGAGLFAAGFSSSITAPLAAALAASSLFGDNQVAWTAKGSAYRRVWGLVLLTGFLFGISGIKPIPAIVLAQALNGLLLPFIAVFLLIVVNDPRIMPRLNPPLSNLLLLLLVGITGLLGLTSLLKAAYSTLGYPFPTDSGLLGYLIAFSTLLMAGLATYVYRLRKAI